MMKNGVESSPLLNVCRALAFIPALLSAMLLAILLEPHPAPESSVDGTALTLILTAPAWMFWTLLFKAALQKRHSN